MKTFTLIAVFLLVAALASTTDGSFMDTLQDTIREFDREIAMSSTGAASIFRGQTAYFNDPTKPGCMRVVRPHSSAQGDFAFILGTDGKDSKACDGVTDERWGPNKAFMDRKQQMILRRTDKKGAYPVVAGMVDAKKNAIGWQLDNEEWVFDGNVSGEDKDAIDGKILAGIFTGVYIDRSHGNCARALRVEGTSVVIAGVDINEYKACVDTSDELAATVDLDSLGIQLKARNSEEMREYHNAQGVYDLDKNAIMWENGVAWSKLHGRPM